MVTIDDDIETMREQTENEFTKKLIFVRQNDSKHVIKSSDNDYDEPDKEMPSVAEMGMCFHCLALALDRMRFQKVGMFNAMKA